MRSSSLGSLGAWCQDFLGVPGSFAGPRGLLSLGFRASSWVKGRVRSGCRISLFTPDSHPELVTCGLQEITHQMCGVVQGSQVALEVLCCCIRASTKAVFSEGMAWSVAAGRV